MTSHFSLCSCISFISIFCSFVNIPIDFFCSLLMSLISLSYQNLSGWLKALRTRTLGLWYDFYMNFFLEMRYNLIGCLVWQFSMELGRRGTPVGQHQFEVTPKLSVIVFTIIVVVAKIHFCDGINLWWEYCIDQLCLVAYLVLQACNRSF